MTDEMNAAEVWMEPQPYYIALRVRPRWKRLLIAPRTYLRYRRAGCRRWFALRFTFQTVTY